MQWNPVMRGALIVLAVLASGLGSCAIGQATGALVPARSLAAPGESRLLSDFLVCGLVRAPLRVADGGP